MFVLRCKSKIIEHEGTDSVFFSKGLMTNRWRVEIKVGEMETKEVLGCALKMFSRWGEIQRLGTGDL